MFYSHFHLKKTGRFGLIWLAATQSRVLSKREIAAINIRGTCDALIRHIPVRDGQSKHSSRFSLYLCCQLIYGSAKVLQRQWEYLLVDVSACYRKCAPDIPTPDIDLGVHRHVVTLESKLPMDTMDLNFDPFFGVSKDLTPDVESVLNALESTHCPDEQLTFGRIPIVVQPEIGSPHSVSDPREISILDVEISQLSIMLPDEQDLPKMDPVGLSELLSPETVLPQTEIQLFTDDAERPVPIQEGANELHDMQPVNTSLMIEDNKFQGLEETPFAKTRSDMPPPPRKPKPGNRRKRNYPESGRGDGKEDAPNSQYIVSPGETNGQTAALAEGQTRQTLAHGHDWEQRKPPAVRLSPMQSEQSPLRKKRPHKLIIDNSLKMSRAEMQEHMENTDDIIAPMIIIPKFLHLGSVEGKNSLKDPASIFLQKNKELCRLFSRNCRFGLRMDDSGSERDSVTSPGLLDVVDKRKRARRGEDGDTLPVPPKISRQSGEMSSIELGRDTSGRLSQLYELDRNLSHSTIAQSIDESIPRSRRQPLSSSFAEVSAIQPQDFSNMSAHLKGWPEEPELNTSTVPIMSLSYEAQPPVPDQMVDLNLQDQQPVQIAPEILDNSYGDRNGNFTNGDLGNAGVLKFIEHHLRTVNDDLTTFRILCPPADFSRSAAASFFFDLCYQVARCKICVRQDEAYGDIYIWLPSEENMQSS